MERLAMRKPFIFLCVLLLCGCSTTANYKKTLDTWNGTHIDKLVSSWGIPHRSYELSNGGTIIEYMQSDTTQSGGFYMPLPGLPMGMISSTTSTLWCKTIFTVDPNGFILSSHFEGNNCRSLPPK